MIVRSEPRYARYVAVPEDGRRARWWELPWYGLAGIAGALLAAGLFVLTVTVFTGSQSAAARQASELGKTVAAYQRQLTADAGRISDLQGQLSALRAKTVPLTADTTRCSTGLSGPAGSVAYYFWCSQDQKPAKAAG